jgi:uncharacterized protein (TIGR03086 family)
MNLALLNEVTEEFASYLSEVTDGDLAVATPCAQWTVQDLYHHVLEANTRLGAALDSQALPPAPRGGCALRETIYRDSARYAADALASSVDIGTRAEVPGGRAGGDLFESHLASTLIHTWDLTQAIQIDFDLPDPRAIEIAVTFLHRLRPDSRGAGKAFAEIVDFPAGMPMGEILILSGRGPDWRAHAA